MPKVGCVTKHTGAAPTSRRRGIGGQGHAVRSRPVGACCSVEPGHDHGFAGRR